MRVASANDILDLVRELEPVVGGRVGGVVELLQVANDHVSAVVSDGAMRAQEERSVEVSVRM